MGCGKSTLVNTKDMKTVHHLHGFNVNTSLIVFHSNFYRLISWAAKEETQILKKLP